MRRATWRNGKRIMTGVYAYSWAGGYFTIMLDQRDRITGENKRIHTYGSQAELPEWGNWKLVRAAQGTEAQRAETENTGSVHDGPVANGDAPKPSQSEGA